MKTFFKLRKGLLILSMTPESNLLDKKQLAKLPYNNKSTSSEEEISSGCRLAPNEGYGEG